MKKADIFKRYVLFIISLFFIGLGIAFTKHAELGISPVSSVANVISLKLPYLSFGSWLVLSNLIFLCGQILLLRHKFNAIQLLQVPLSFLFGFFTDFGLWIAMFFCNKTYLWQITLLIIGNFILALGISLSITADVLLNSAEGFVKALSVVTGKKFSTVKIFFDICWVLLAAMLSLICFDGALVGVREGTFLSALLVGVFVKLMRPLFKALEKRLYNVGL